MRAEDICRIDDETVIDGILVYSSSDEISRSVFESCSNLKVVSRHGVGLENIDLQAAGDYGVPVKTTQECFYHETVADFTLGLILALCRGICQGDNDLKDGYWHRPLTVDFWGKTLGIIGLGRIGKAVARRSKGFGVTVVGCDPHVDPAIFRQEGVISCTLDELLSRSDMVTIHCPLHERTGKIIKERELKLMKPGAFLVNTARAGLVDQAALVKALKNGDLAGAAVDIYEHEPAQSDPLVLSQLKNLITTPHIASFTKETIRRMDLLAVRNALEAFEKVDNETDR